VTRARLFLAAGLVAFAGPAHAFDCKKAGTKSEKAICADPAALAADSAMSAAFQTLIASAPAAQKSQITASQVGWLRTRDGNCAEATGAELGACLARESERRRAFLEGRPEAGPGAPGRIAPWFRYEKGGHGRAEIDFALLKFVDPQAPAERAFNAAVERVTKDIIEPEKDEPNPDSYAFDWSMELTWASPRLVSAHLTGYMSAGGAHPNTSSASVNIDYAAGRELKFADAFASDAATKIVAFCLKSVRAQKQDKMGDEAPKSADDLKTLAGQVDDATRDLAAWSFGADAATVNYDPYAVGSYAEGAYVCEIPYATLRGWTKPGFPLP
jgi:uncharacterized protein YecT (DUF1311 family)